MFTNYENVLNTSHPQLTYKDHTIKAYITDTLKKANRKFLKNKDIVRTTAIKVSFDDTIIFIQ